MTYTPCAHLIRVCKLPANPADITLEHARALCGGDVTAVLQDIVRECLAAPQPAPTVEGERASA